MRILLDVREILPELPAPETDRGPLFVMKRRVIRQVSRYFDEAAQTDGDGLFTYAADLECYDDAGVEGTLLGALDPEALIAEAEAWNGLIRKSFVARLEAVFGAEGGMIDTAADFAMGTLETCALSAAAMMIDDEFAPAADYAVFYSRDDGFRPLLRKYMLDGIKAHPERYAIADITVKSY